MYHLDEGGAWLGLSRVGGVDGSHPPRLRNMARNGYFSCTRMVSRVDHVSRGERAFPLGTSTSAGTN